MGLNVGDVDLKAGTLHIRTKGGGQDRVFLNPVMVRMLGRLLSLGYARDKRESAPEGNTGPNPSATLGTCGVPLFRSQSGCRLGAGQI